jgi:hypothetical protein
MTLDELRSLGSFFSATERTLDGKPVRWEDYSYATMRHIVLLREHLAAPIILIRGAHPGKPSAIDACCPSRPLAQVFMALTRLVGASWGIYSGRSFHVDTRPYEKLPARWLAIKDSEEQILQQRGLAALVAYRQGGWIYLSYDHPRSLDAVLLVCELADKKAQIVAAV